MKLREIKGVGPAVLKKLEKLSIFSIHDLLFHYPSRYVDRTRYLKIFDLKFIEDDSYHCIARIKNLKRIRLRGRRDFTTATLEDDTGYVSVAWFNNPYIVVQYSEGDEVIFSGKIVKGKVSNPKIKKVDSEDDIKQFAKIEAIYPETRGLKSYQLNQFIYFALKYLYALPEKERTKVFKEGLPKPVIKKERFISKLEALKILHFPQNLETLDDARDRLGFEEIYTILKKVEKRKKTVKTKPAHKVTVNSTAHDVLQEKLSFELTSSQQQSVQDIFADLGKQVPMHRLLNGDVGSGKTIVAASAAWQVANNGLQTIILAPTGVLAKQHYLGFKKLFDEYDIPVHLITSDTRKDIERFKTENLHDANTNDIFIGTHALLYHLEIFRKIGLLVIDEQHKFGVKQRELLGNIQKEGLTQEESHVEKVSEPKIDLASAKLPHILSMSATPIPRSLALTFFGDIDVSFLEKPEGRKKIITKVLNDETLKLKMYEWLRHEINTNKAQAYVVCPLIEDSEKLTAKSATEEFHRLQEIYPEFKIGLLHGRIKSTEKDLILQQFKDGEFQVLVSTSVIEVGIDNPNATVMLIESAEKFGLAQLHQIRGRVGRSDKQSFCFLMTSDGSYSPRLEYFASTNDGFKVAEYDLHQRGPGEVYGEVQSGLPDLKIANILDLEMIKRVKKYIK